MALKINPDDCTSCAACELECPNGAISARKGTYVIDPGKCTECEGKFKKPQCAAVCPTGACVPS